MLRFGASLGHPNRSRLRNPGAVCQGGRRVAGPPTGRSAPGPRLRDRSGVAPLQVVAEGRNPGACRRLAPARPDRKQQPPRRSGDWDEVSRPTSRGIPRKVSWLVHQHRAAYELAGTVYSDFGHDERDVGPAGDAARAGRADAGRVRGPLHHLAHRQRSAAPVQRPGIHAALSPAAARAAARAGTLGGLRSVGGAPRGQQARGPAGPRDGPRTRFGYARDGRRRQPASSHRAGGGGGWRLLERPLRGRGGRRCAGDACIARRWRWPTSLSTRTMGSPRWRPSSRPSRLSPLSDSGGTLEFVDARGERAGRGARARGDWRRAGTAGRATPRSRRGSATPAAASRARSPGTRSSTAW